MVNPQLVFYLYNMLEQPTSPPSRILLAVRLIFSLWLAAIVFATVYPDPRVWGLHLPAFLPVWAQTLFFGTAAILFLLPRRWFDRFSIAISRCAGRNLDTLYPAVILIGAFILFRSATALLGDGMLRAGEPELGKFHLLEFLPGYLAKLAYAALNPKWGIRGPQVMAAISILAGIGFLYVLWRFPRRLWEDSADRTTARAMLILSGTTALYFGYIETYALPCAAMTAVLLAGETFRRGKCGFAPVIICFIIALGTHFLTVILYPALVMLGIAARKKQRIYPALIGALGLATAVWGYMIFTGEDVVRGTMGHAVFVPLFADPPLNYGLFSGSHLLDMINLLCLIAPGVMVAAPLLLARGTAMPKNAHDYFWPLAVIVPFGIIFLLDPKLGMARDWDLFSLGLIPCGVYAAISLADTRPRLPRGALTLPLFTAAAVLVMFVGINADTTRSITRYENLLQLDKGRGGYGYETLAYFYYTRGETGKVIDSWHKALELDNNPRYWMQLSTLYRSQGDQHLALSTARQCFWTDSSSAAGAVFLARTFDDQGNHDSALYYLDYAARLAPADGEIQHDLAETLYLRGRMDDARRHIEIAVELAPDSAKYYNVLGAVLIQTGEFAEAIPALNRVLALCPTHKDGRLNLALAYYFNRQDQLALAELAQLSRQSGLTAEEQRAIATLASRIQYPDSTSIPKK